MEPDERARAAREGMDGCQAKKVMREVVGKIWRTESGVIDGVEEEEEEAETSYRAREPVEVAAPRKGADVDAGAKWMSKMAKGVESVCWSVLQMSGWCVKSRW